MARTATVEKEEQRQIEIPVPKYRHATRALAAYPSAKTYTGNQLDEFCETYVKQGYRLHSWLPTYVKSEQGPGGILISEAEWHILYLFVKD